MSLDTVSILDGNTFVVIPVDPCGAGVLTRIRFAGIRIAYSRVRASFLE